MAVYTPAGEKFTVSFHLAATDEHGIIRERNKEFELAAAITTHAGATAAVEALQTTLAVILKCDILGFTINTKRKAAVANAASVANMRAEGTLTLNPADGSDKIFHTIFAPATAIVAGSTLVNGNTDLLAYVDNFKAAGSFRVSDGESVTATSPIASSGYKITGTKYG